MDYVDVIYNIFFTSEGMIPLTLSCLIIVLLIRFYGKPEEDTSKQELKELWDKHQDRFPTLNEKDSGDNKQSLKFGQNFQQSKREMTTKNTVSGIHILREVQRETRLIATSYGKCSVHIIGELRSPKTIFTLPEIGTSHLQCFPALVQELASLPDIFEEYCIIHASYAGHLEAGNEGCYDFPTSFGDVQKMIWEVLDSLSISYFIGIGVGFGATTLLHMACFLPSSFFGLILICPFGEGEKMGYGEELILSDLATSPSSHATLNLLFSPTILASSSINANHRVSWRHFNKHAVSSLFRSLIDSKPCLSDSSISALSSTPILLASGGFKSSTKFSFLSLDRTENTSQLAHRLIEERVRCELVIEEKAGFLITEENSDARIAVKIFIETLE